MKTILNNDHLNYNHVHTWIPLFEVDIITEILYYTPNLEAIATYGHVYIPFPCELDTLSEVSTGEIPSAKSVWSDITGTLISKLKTSGSIDGQPINYRLVLIPTIWEANTVYIAGDKVYASSFESINTYYKTGRIYECTTPGTSGGNAPTWPITVGGTVTDNTIVWTEDSAATDNILVSESLEVLKVSSVSSNTIVMELGPFNPYLVTYLQERYLKDFCWNTYKGKGCYILQPDGTYTKPNGETFDESTCDKTLATCKALNKKNTARFNAVPTLSATGGRFV